MHFIFFVQKSEKLRKYADMHKTDIQKYVKVHNFGNIRFCYRKESSLSENPVWLILFVLS